MFVLTYFEIYVFRGNPFQAHSLQQIYHQKYKGKNNIKLIYLTFIYCTCKFEKHKQSFLSENYEQTFSSKKHKKSNAHEKCKQSFPSENYNRTSHAQPIVFLRICCSVLTLLIKTVRCSVRSL